MRDLASEIPPAIYRVQLRDMVAKGVVYYGYGRGRPVVLPQSMVQGESKQYQSRMLSIFEGVMESQWRGDEEIFEAAVDTDEGPKNLKGTVVPPHPSVEIQSGAVAIARWQVGFREADQAIRNAYDTLVPREAIRVISTIWEQLDRTSELAAARSRLLIGKLGKPRLAPLPDWFKNQRDKLSMADEGEVIANPRAVAVAELLIRAAIAAVPDNLELAAEIETGPMGRVVIDWCVPKGRLQWMVDAIEIPWPSVKVYQVSHPSESGLPKKLGTHIFFNAFDAIDSFVGFLGI
jgi:hypothetical protein